MVLDMESYGRAWLTGSSDSDLSDRPQVACSGVSVDFLSLRWLCMQYLQNTMSPISQKCPMWRSLQGQQSTTI